MIKLIFTLLFILFLISGCTSNCIMGEDDNITVSVVENRDISTNMGLTNHHNVTLKIVNVRDTVARSVKIDTYYCNDFIPQFRRCENRSSAVGDIPPNGGITRSFEYDRSAIENAVDGRYQLQYKAVSCLPILIVNNSVIINQR